MRHYLLRTKEAVETKDNRNLLALLEEREPSTVAADEFVLKLESAAVRPCR
jgi:hypothetical protein